MQSCLPALFRRSRQAPPSWLAEERGPWEGERPSGALLEDELKTKGNAAFAAKNYDEAIDFYSRGIVIDPNNHVLFSNRSACHAGKQNWAQAVEDADKCISIKPDWGKGYGRKGAALHGKGDLEGAHKAYKAGLAVEPGLAMLSNGIAKVEASEAQIKELAAAGKAQEEAAQRKRKADLVVEWAREKERERNRKEKERAEREREQRKERAAREREQREKEREERERENARIRAEALYLRFGGKCITCGGCAAKECTSGRCGNCCTDRSCERHGDQLREREEREFRRRRQEWYRANQFNSTFPQLEDPNRAGRGRAELMNDLKKNAVEDALIEEGVHEALAGAFADEILPFKKPKTTFAAICRPVLLGI